jgi:phosphoglycolate phosphatase
MNNSTHIPIAILFDVDGTLIDAFDCHFHGQSSALTQVFGLDGQRDLSFSGHLLPEGLRKMAIKHGGKPEDVEPLLQAGLRVWSDRTIEHLNNGGKCVALPGVTELLDYLYVHGYKLAIITGSTRLMAMALLEKVGFLKYFQFLATGEEAETRPQLAALALARLRETQPDLLSSQVVMVGDSPNDIQAGKAIGAYTVAVATGVHALDDLEKEEPDALLPDLSDLKRTLNIFKII